MATPAETKPAGRNRSQFVRTKIPFVERVASVICVLLLAGIGIAIFIKGRHFDPNRFSLRPDALNSTIATPEGKAGTLRGEAAANRRVGETATAPATKSGGESAVSAGEPGAESGEAGAVSASPSATKGEPLEISIAGLKPMGDTENYSPDNLFEKIDGRAPAYLQFNFQHLRCRTFEITGSGGSFVDVYEYRMDTPVNAFGIFALERDPKGRLLDFAPDGYSGEMGFFFRQGNCYVQIIASDQKPKTIEMATALAQDRAKNLPADDTGLDARRRLPADGLIPESVAFVQENAQGQDFLKNVFQADYQFEGAKLPFFLMVTPPEAAASAWNAYKTFAEKYGKVSVLPETNGAQIFQVETFGSWKVVYQRQGELGGVYDAADGEKGRQFVEKYLQGLIK